MFVKVVLFTDVFYYRGAHLLHAIPIEQFESLLDGQTARVASVLHHGIIDNLDLSVLGDVLMLVVAAILADKCFTIEIMLELLELFSGELL